MKRDLVEDGGRGDEAVRQPVQHVSETTQKVKHAVRYTSLRERERERRRGCGRGA